MRNKPHARFALTMMMLAGIALLSGCVTTHVEMDRMTGTAFPTEQTLDGRDWTLESIFLEAGHIIDVDEDDTNIAPLRDGSTQQQCITDAELETVEIANRASPVTPTSFACGAGIFRGTCTRYEAYGIVVDHVGQCFGSCRSSLLGCMYDTTDRSAFSLYFQNSTVSSDGQRYLRTTAHELGHAFNLHHPDGSGSETLMNTTGTVGNSFTYTFSTDSEEHLQEHDAQCRFPGTGAWFSVTDDHATRHGNATCP